ncbi:MAG: SdpI family protein [Desulfotomaculaceae bacterium]|nr:SdpI family protein [Desulfotomaculaceae bacterium]
MQENSPDFRKALVSDWPIILLIIGSLVAGLLVYPHLPELVPSHWNIRGEVDDYSSRFWGAFGLPLMTAGIYVLMTLVPSIDPRRQNYQKFTGAYRVLKVVFVVFMTGLYALVILSSLGWQTPMGRAVTGSIGLLFIIIGNYMGQFRHNYFVGIKTPWTLADERVWQKTHRLGGKIWVLAGLLGLVAAVCSGTTGAVILGIAISMAVVVPAVYSYLEFRRLQ